MSTNIIQAQYDNLTTIASRFGQQIDATSILYCQVMQSYQPLEQGGWEGQGATAFYDEMQNEVFPAMQRLMSALSEAQMVTLQIRDIIWQAEEEAASVFGVDGTGVAGGGGEAGATTSGATSPGTAIPTLPLNQIFNESYMNKITTRHWKGEDSDALNQAMHILQGDPNPEDAARALDIIARQRGIDRAVIEEQYQKFKKLQKEAIANGLARENPEVIDSLPNELKEYMGSREQLRYGQIVGDALGLDPVFGALLNPTGGLPGPGADVIPINNFAISHHSAFHDGGGFLELHFDKGPGFDYLKREGDRPSDDPFTGQESGLRYWNEKYLDRAKGNLSLLDKIIIPGSNIVGAGMGIAVDIETGINSVATGIHDTYEAATDYVGNKAEDVYQDINKFARDFFSW
jgi:WXG100 family type VII secretion target